MINDVLTEFRDWKLEAKLEDSARYFYEVQEVSSIESGSKSYVIGRKGTGKTAIGERFLARNSESKQFSIKVSFKNFPFNQLYTSTDPNYTRPNQYITLWKYIIYMSVCRLMRDNSNINFDARAHLRKLIPDDGTSNIARLISKWVAKDFEFKLFGSGTKIT